MKTITELSPSKLIRYNVAAPDMAQVGLYQAKAGDLVAYEVYKALRDTAFGYLEDPCEANKRLLLEEITRETTG